MQNNANSITLTYKFLFIIPIFYVFFYLIYAFNAWFYQDDFTFLYRHIITINWENIWNFGNFGRFVSRDLYWYSMYQFFGFNSVFYFVFNLTLLILNAFLCYLFLKQMNINLSFSVLSGIAYFISLPALVNFYWISNSQHLLAHTFIFIFLILITKNTFFLSSSWKNQLVAFLIFIVALYSNILSFFILPFLFFRIYLFRNSIIFSKQLGFFLIGILTVGILFILKIKQYSTGAYRLDYSFSALINNLNFYLEPYNLNPYLFLVLVVIISVYSIIFKKENTSQLLILSMFLYAPFALASAQQYHNYVHLSTVFLIVTFLSFLNKKINKYIISILTIAILIYSGKGFINYMSNDPLGKKVKILCETLKKNYPSEKHFIFYASNGKDIPIVWWATGFGDGLRLFVDPNATYEYSSNTENSSCFVKMSDHLTIDEIECQKSKGLK